MKLLRKLRRIFDKRTKFRLFIILVGVVFGALLEIVALSLISPLISVLLEPGGIYDNVYIVWVFDFLGFSHVSQFMALVAFALAGVYVVRGAYLYTLNRIQFRFIARRQVELSSRLLNKILGYSYIYHANHNLAELQRMALTDVSVLMSLVSNAILLATDFLVMIMILGFLAAVSPAMTLFVTGMAMLCVALYLYVFRGAIKTAGEKARKSSILMAKNVNQGLGGIKEVKILQREGYFSRAFLRDGSVYAVENSRYQALNVVPKIMIEGVCFGGAFAVLGAAILWGADISGILPQLGIFVLAAFRILPAVTRMTKNYNSFIYCMPSVDAVYKNMFEEADVDAGLSSNLAAPAASGSEIRVVGVRYQYPDMESAVLEKVDLTIPEKSSVAFVGPSGAGKTTLVDLILGVLVPAAGGVFYKGKSIHHDFGSWSKNVGYIPQQIYLLDETIIENVAFGIDRKDIDGEKVWRALEQAQLADFVRSLPQAIDTIVGDRGIRLSGGQRQRIGIARALYEDPPILVLDEATSSLDNETEKAVMDAVKGFKGSKTMLIVAHRISTIEHCDIVYRVEHKTVVKER